MKPAVKTARRLCWKDVYREVELYKAAVRVYTTSLFHWGKALNVSTDGKTLYELAGRGLRALDAIEGALQREAFQFRPSIGLTYNFNGKRRTLYIPPWEERIVDLLLYRVLNQRLHHWFSPNSFAYRDHTYGLDSCQSRIARLFRSSQRSLYLIKRDVSDYFASVHHEVLLRQLCEHVEPDDYLFQLLRQRIQFVYQDETGIHEATKGIPFGCASACLFANIYLTKLDRAIEQLPDVHYFRYAGDLLARERLFQLLGELKLSTKASHEADLLLSAGVVGDHAFRTVSAFRHLGLLFRAGGEVLLSRDKRRKIQNLFRFAFRRKRRTWKRIGNPRERARTLAAIASETVGKGVRNVAIVDYYLKHVTDVAQLRLLDRWLAEEVLNLVFGGHKKGHFAKLSFETLREFGLPALVHRQRLIVHGHTESAFFVWQKQKADRAFRGTVARLARTAGVNQTSLRAQKQQPTTPVGEGGCL
jgi:retron-type reverse transcriptase